MRKISDALEAIVEGNPALAFGLHHRLLNLTKLARFLRPSVEAQTRKGVSDSAVLMSLSRLQRLGPEAARRRRTRSSWTRSASSPVCARSLSPRPTPPTGS
jgi:hypothetical protein